MAGTSGDAGTTKVSAPGQCSRTSDWAREETDPAAVGSARLQRAQALEGPRAVRADVEPINALRGHHRDAVLVEYRSRARGGLGPGSSGGEEDPLHDRAAQSFSPRARRCFSSSSFWRSAGSASARIWTARIAAFFAPAEPMATVATGTPAGICTVE